MSENHEIAVEIGGLPILLRTQDGSFRDMLADRYAGFVGSPSRPRFEFDVDLVAPSEPLQSESENDLRVELQNGTWRLQRGDFNAHWNPEAGRGRVRQSPNPYSIDSVLRIVHTLILAKEGGFLLHAASVVRNGRAFLFSGVSGAGKTTISRLAPPDVTLLTDEISYVRRASGVYRACGTPFAGELRRVGENCSAPLGALFFLTKASENRIDSIDPPQAMHLLLRNILFFAEDAELVKMLFDSACDFVENVPVRRLNFTPDSRVWELIQ
jgi:hypothetical protein